ncbi:MAG: 4Fe-4S binding protein [Clostridiales bacterium]|nr:4Fe-4S binding protein [Clostridiales bacterium]
MQELTDIVQIKHEALKLTAKHAFSGTLYQQYEQIPYEMIPGIKPRFRCCVYREREIVRQRVRMAMGKLPIDVMYTDKDSTQVVHVIPCACEGCPISKITVTPNCQSCLAKKCVKACPFGAISATPSGAVIDQSKCRKCGKCVAACPYNAIVEIERPCRRSCPVKAISMDENDIATIDPAKCVNCGACVIGCPFGAISDVSMMVNVIDALQDRDKEVVAMIAPAIEGQFGTDTLPQIKRAIRQLGFDDVYEVALGADMVAYSEAEELLERKEAGEKLTSSCCPAFVNLVRKHFPDLMKYVSTTVSPMVAVERYIRSQRPDVVTVFIGPCIAKKNEVMAGYVDEIDYVLTFEELYAMLCAKGVSEPGDDSEEDTGEDATRYGKGFALSGGVTGAVRRVLEERGATAEIRTLKCSGADECRKAMLMLKAGRLPEDFVEGMFCEGGCIGGPATLDELHHSKKVLEGRMNGMDSVVRNVEEKELHRADIHRHH